MPAELKIPQRLVFEFSLEFSLVMSNGPLESCNFWEFVPAKSVSRDIAYAQNSVYIDFIE